jgi:hypothetical protein
MSEPRKKYVVDMGNKTQSPGAGVAPSSTVPDRSNPSIDCPLKCETPNELPRPVSTKRKIPDINRGAR